MRVPGVPFVQGRNSYSDVDGRKFGIAIHCTANTATARGEAAFAARRTDGTSSHFYADATEVIQSLDTKAKAGHAGSTAGNEHAIAFEITGVNSWSRQQWLANVCWVELARVLAAVCREYGIEPRRATVAQMRANPRVQAFYSHDDMRQAWGNTTHTDPGPNFPWDHLLAAVRAELEGDMALSADDAREVRRQVALGLYDVLHVAANGTDYNGLKFTGPGSIGAAVAANLGALTARPVIAALSAADLVDEQAVVSGVLAGLSPEAIAAAIPATLAAQVVDLLAARLAAPDGTPVP